MKARYRFSISSVSGLRGAAVNPQLPATSVVIPCLSL